MNLIWLNKGKKKKKQSKDTWIFAKVIYYDHTNTDNVSDEIMWKWCYSNHNLLH